MTKLQTKKQKARVLKDHKARLIKEAEDAAVQKKFELEQLQQSFKYQISLLENEIGQYKNDIVKLEQTKEGALTDVHKQFNDQVQQLQDKYTKEIKMREDELQQVKQRLAQSSQKEELLNQEVVNYKGVIDIGSKN